MRIIDPEESSLFNTPCKDSVWKTPKAILDISNGSIVYGNDHAIA
jgi:hypothetical protein